MEKTTVLVESSTRERLKKIGKKGQSYDELINELIDNNQANLVANRGEHR